MERRVVEASRAYRDRLRETIHRKVQPEDGSGGGSQVDTRQRILTRAVELASLEGLEGLTIGRLAGELGVSKSGVFAHFGSKEELQLQTVDAAIQRFLREVIAPVMTTPRGLVRLRSMLESFVSYVERSVFPGGCFFAAAALEFDGRPGVVRDRIATAMNWWFSIIQEEIEAAQDLGQFRGDFEARQLAFELHGAVQEANWGYQMFHDPEWFVRSRQSIQAALTRAAR